MFDRALIEMLSLPYLKQELKDMPNIEDELIAATSDRGAQALRIAMGLLM